MSLDLDGVSLQLDGRVLIDRLSLRIAPGTVATLMGPSGSGKSSLLAFLTGTLPPAFATAGHVTLDGTDLLALPPQQRRVGILFQDDLLVASEIADAENIGLQRLDARQQC